MQFHQLHASGHLDKEGVEMVVKEIDAKRVFPVHTENPAAFKEFSKNVQIAKKEKECII